MNRAESEGLWRFEMKIKRLFIASSLVALTLAVLPFSAAAGETTGSSTAVTMPASLDDTLVIVDKILGVDATGKQRILYDEEHGRVYRLQNIEQAIHDMSARGIVSKGSYRSLRAVLNETVYLIGKNETPYPARRADTPIPEIVPLAVENLRVTKDRVIAIYTTNCDNSAI
ncbi:MAG: hypothetical protein DBP03_03520 [gamma proteobacterium symbiont of Ctena orbiculata]|nr:MAG: hypothetical protein DBP03_03520 [gamma proteobacterium symbiont of Ctena orbiculata]